MNIKCLLRSFVMKRKNAHEVYKIWDGYAEYQKGKREIVRFLGKIYKCGRPGCSYVKYNGVMSVIKVNLTRSKPNARRISASKVK